MCKQYNVLPQAGGLFDQDAYIVYGLSAVVKAVAEREQKENKKQDDEIKRMRNRSRGYRGR